jgi:transposase
MKRLHVIALDTHCAFTAAAVLGRSGEVVVQQRVPTRIPELRALVEGVPRPRHVVLEEGPLADWLVRELRPAAEAVVACDPRRNAYIAKAGDKDDPIDAVKLGQLYRGGFVSAVHHPETLERAAFKQLVGLYHDRVRNVVRHGNRILSQFRRYGVFATTRALRDAQPRAALLAQVPSAALRAGIELVLAEFDLARDSVARLRRIMMREARRHEAIMRFMAVPGVRWVRAATFYAYVDTPWRFASKAALWRYLGIGLERRHSGSGVMLVRVPHSVTVCRPLKAMIVGAAKSAIVGDNPFAARYEEWRHAGVSPRNAVRNVARSLAATLWALFKNGGRYEPAWVGVSPVAGSPNGVSHADG